MAITVRYGPSGAGLQAAVQAGEGQDFWRRYQAEQGMVQDIRNYYLQQDALALEAQKLQLAGEQARRKFSTPTAGQTRVTQSPIGSSVVANLQQLNISPDDQARLDLYKQYTGRVPEAEARRIFGAFGGTGRGSPLQTSKQAYLSAVAQDLDLDEGQAAALAALVQDESVNYDDFQQTVREARQVSQNQAVQQRYETSLQDRQLYNQQRLLQNEVERLQKEITEAGFDPGAAPAQFNPQVRDTSGTGIEFIDDLTEGYIHGTPISGGSPEMRDKHLRMVKLQNQLKALQQQREGLVQAPGGAGRPGGDVTQQSTESLLQQLLGG